MKDQIMKSSETFTIDVSLPRSTCPSSHPPVCIYWICSRESWEKSTFQWIKESPSYSTATKVPGETFDVHEDL